MVKVVVACVGGSEDLDLRLLLTQSGTKFHCYSIADN